jgi:hypothetical protein
MDRANSWSEAIAPLAGARAQAETCVALLKKYGNETQIASGQLTYVKAKSESDAAIAGLLTALATGDAPGSLSFLQTRITNSAVGLAEFSNFVNQIISTSVPPGQRDVASALAKILGVEPFVKAISDGVAAIYNNYRGDSALTRKVIQTQLEGAKWPDFAEVKPA